MLHIVAPKLFTFTKHAVKHKKNICPASGGFFDRFILTGSVLKLILDDFSSNFILNRWPVNFFDQSNNLLTGVFIGVREWLSIIMELSIHCYTNLVFSKLDVNLIIWFQPR